MDFNRHSNLKGAHAFLSASKPHWVNYDDEHFDRVFDTYSAAQRGTELHDLAKRMIDLGVRLPKSEKTLNMYVNDAIGFRMVTEQPLFVDWNCFGTVDAICFRMNILRIHDLKTGLGKCKVTQLEIYAAMFCLEYDKNPNDIEIELRIYQNDGVHIFEGDPRRIFEIMQKIKYLSKRTDERRKELQ